MIARIPWSAKVKAAAERGRYLVHTPSIVRIECASVESFIRDWAFAKQLQKRRRAPRAFAQTQGACQPAPMPRDAGDREYVRTRNLHTIIAFFLTALNAAVGVVASRWPSL